MVRYCILWGVISLLQRLRLKFSTLSLEYDPGCNYDYVAIYDKPSGKFLAKFCGSTCEGEVTVPSNMAKVVFHSNSQGVGQGFKLKYWRVDDGKYYLNARYIS